MSRATHDVDGLSSKVSETIVVGVGAAAPRSMNGAEAATSAASTQTVKVAIVFRACWRWFHPPPPMPDWMPRWERIGASATHVALYACMLIMPLTGYIASNFSQWGVKYFNAIQLPPWGIDDERVYAFFNGAHVVTSYVFVALILLHAVSAIWHAWLRDGILGRMWLTRRG